jgi:uncharacterized protein YeaO (DUF488 family)
MIRIQRVYETPPNQKGSRFLVDRLWPRGIKKENLNLKGWLKEVAPSQQLRQWFGHDPKRWNEFRLKYFSELDKKPESWQPLLDASRDGDIILLYGAKEEKFNNALALKEYLEVIKKNLFLKK